MAKQLPPGQSPVAGQLQIRAEAVSFTGPLPPPEILIRYNEAFPGCAERIVIMAERQSDHRQSLENRAMNSNFVSERLGIILGFVLAMSVIAGGFWLIHEGKDTIGLVAIIGDLVALVSVFVYGKKKTAEERAVKAAGLPTITPAQR